MPCQCICPVGIATQKRWLVSGLDPAHKSVRFANYLKAINKEIVEITHACGYEHPCQMTMHDVEVGMGEVKATKTLEDNLGYQKIPVQFDGMESVMQCPYLDAKQGETAKV